MSSPIAPLGGVEPGNSTEAATAAGSTRQATRSSATDGEEVSVQLDTFPSSPPPEVSELMATAAQAYEKLQGSGREVRFQTDPQSGQTTIELHDGQSSRTLSPGELIEAAAGRPLD